MTIPYNPQLRKVHPLARQHEKEMLATLKASPNWKEGTSIGHEQDKTTDNVRFHYDFPDSEDKEKDAIWDAEIRAVINKYP